jgi:uridine kinase
LARCIAERRRDIPATRAILVALSGIDASGKGYVARRLSVVLQSLRIAIIGVDDWLNVPSIRFTDSDRASHFYRCAFRFDDMFKQLVLPLRDRRSIRVVCARATETAQELTPHEYVFEDVDVILLEGIFLLKKILLHHYDWSIWVDCPWESALRRAVARNQEGMSPEATRKVYRELYFPAQTIHLRCENPIAAADIVISNA